MTDQKILGVIGGLGPMATAYFMELITKMTDAATDQAHLEMIVYSDPAIPDRTGYILGRSQQNPFPRILELGKALKAQGATCIAIPCITAHYFYESLSAALSVPVIHAVRETAHCLKAEGITQAGIMATEGTIGTGIFHRELEENGITPIVPDETHQELITSLIYDDIKANRRVDPARFHQAGNHLKDQGAQAVILGCTELSLVKRDFPLGGGYLDAMEVLARQSILACGKPVKAEYRHLVSV